MSALDDACTLRGEIAMFEHDHDLRQSSRRREVRRLWLVALVLEGETWADIQRRCGVNSRTLSTQLSLAREENPDLGAERLPRNRPTGQYACPECGMVKSSRQALALHRRRARGHTQAAAS